MIKKYKDWASWRDGLRSNIMKSGATSLVTSFTTLLGTNGIDALNIPGLKGIGMNWKTALCQLLVQFSLHVGLAIATYIQNKPDPDVVTEDIPTSFITKQNDENKNP